jgi:anti-sigma B factor antagonist
VDIGQVQLSHRRAQDVTVIKVAGELDLATSDQAAGYIARARRGDDDRLVFDLADMVFMDSSGLRVLVNAWKHARAHGGVVHLAALRPNSLSVFDITQMNAYLPVHLNVDEAVAAASQSAQGPGTDGAGGAHR